MPFIALLIGLPVTAILILISIYIYNFGIKKIGSNIKNHSYTEGILYLVLCGLPLTVVISLYLAGVLAFGIECDELHYFITHLSFDNIKIFPLGILMLLLAGTINVISPINIPIDGGHPINTSVETTILFVITFALNVFISRKLILKLTKS